MVWEPVGKRFWVMGGSGEATLIDPAALQETGVVDLGEELEFAVTDGKGHVFVNATESATVIAVDAASRKIIGHWKIQGCEDPSGLAYSEAADVLLSVCANKMLKVLDAHTGSELTTLEVGAGADAVIYDNTTRRAYVTFGVRRRPDSHTGQWPAGRQSARAGAHSGRDSHRCHRPEDGDLVPADRAIRPDQ